jgi:hypothetical protein
MSFTRLGDRNEGRKNNYAEGVQMADDYGRPISGPPPAYMMDRPDTLRRPWWDVRAWGWKRFAIAGALVVIIIIIIVVAAVEATKKNKYPSYTKLNYKVVDTCAYLPTPFTEALLM